MTTPLPFHAPHGARDEGPRGWGLALGGGGSVGLAYVAGVMTAMSDAGVDIGSAGLMVGTSAGAIAAAALRKGMDPEDLVDLADAPPDEAAASAGRSPRHFEPAWTGGRDLCSRLVGSTAVLARSVLPLALPGHVRLADDYLPGGLFRPRGNGLRPALGDQWPDEPLWLMAVDLHTRRRVAIGRRREDRRHPLHAAVMASCSVPGLYEPARLGSRRLVDGGVNSTTSIDMSVRAGCSRVLAVVPLGYENGRRPSTAHRVLRRAACRGVQRELRRAGERARDVLVVQPHPDDLDVYGTNFLKPTDNHRVAQRARERTHDSLQLPEVADFVAGLGERVAS